MVKDEGMLRNMRSDAKIWLKSSALRVRIHVNDLHLMVRSR